MLEDKKKLLLVVCKPVGGIRTFIRYVYRKFDPKSWSIGIIAPDIPEMQLLVEDLSVLGITHIVINGNPYPSPMALMIKVASELSSRRYDLVHSHGFLSGICTSLPAKLTRTTHLMTSHDIININQFSGFKGAVKRQVMGRMLSLINTIHSVSHDACNNLSSYFPFLTTEEGKSVVILNGIDVDEFHNAAPRDLKNELGLGDDHFLIGFFGRFMSQKGFRYLVDAVELLRGQKLLKRPVVLTFGYGGFVREERQAISDRGLEDYFRYMPFEANIAGAIKGLDVVAVPSLWEACPLLPMETLCCGTPLITSDCIGMREVVFDTPAKVVAMADSADLAKALVAEISRPSKQSFADYSPVAQNRFDVNATYSQMEKLYSHLTK